MSDAMAEQKEAEVTQEKTEAQKQEEERQARLWTLTLVLDPALGQFAMIPNQNIEKQWQLDTLVNLAQSNIMVTKISRQVNQERQVMESSKDVKKLAVR